MRAGFVGLGAVVETAWLPALKRLGILRDECWGFDNDPTRTPEGIRRCDHLDTLLSQPLEWIFITTSSLAHLPVLEHVLKTPVARIVVEKPVAATLSQLTRLQQLLSRPENAHRVLALDHWMARDGVLQLALGTLGQEWQPEGDYAPLPPQVACPEDIVSIKGFLLEPSGFNSQGEPIALNFATGEPDTRHLQHPDGVIVDIGTHVLTMLRETLASLGISDTLTLKVVKAVDRLGHPIALGDFRTAEGEAHLQGESGGIPLDIWLNKYAGPKGGQKGLRLMLRNGVVLSQDRRGASEVLECRQGEKVYRWTLPGAVYDRCLQRQIVGEDNLFQRAPQHIAPLTQRRIAEVTCLLQLQQRLRGPH